MIVQVIKSPVKNKRYRAYIKRKDGTTDYYDFGFEFGKTFIDGRTEDERKNYLARHLANKTEKQLITNLVPSSSLLSAYLLWGKSRDLETNIKHLNDLWRKLHK
jgi:hypothetical protein